MNSDEESEDAHDITKARRPGGEYQSPVSCSGVDGKVDQGNNDGQGGQVNEVDETDRARWRRNTISREEGSAYRSPSAAVTTGDG